MSSERWHGRYMAAFYSREGILALDRDQRIAHMEAKLAELRHYIHMERCDAEYAAEAREKLVDYRDHIDGFCSYWQNLRWRRFYFAGLKCEACGDGGSLECHHVDYGALGHEELDDVRALCPSCHKASHNRR